MSSRAKIIFFPKNTSGDFCLDKIQILEKASCWTYNTSDFVQDGYVYTNTENSADTLNANYWIKFKAVQGYKITDCHKTNSGGTSNRGVIDIDSNGVITVYPWESGTSAILNNYLYIMVEEDTSSNYTVTQDLQHCTSDAQQFYNSGDNVTITLACEAGYKFDNAPVMTMGGNAYNFTISADRATATLTLTVSDDMWIVAAGTSYKALTLILEHCTCNLSEEVKQGYNTFILTCESGYVFHDNIQLLDYGTHISESFNDFTDGNTRCTFEHDVRGAIRIEASAIRKTEKLSSFANLYRVDSDILDSLSKARFYKIAGQSDVESVDYGQYITSLYTLPFALDDTMIADRANIQLGSYDSRVQAEMLSRYNYIVSMGSITIPEKYHNAYDYRDTICILHVPFTDEIQLESVYVVNHALTLEFRIDLYSGECTLNVYSDIVNEVIASKSFTIGTQIPFMQMQTGGTINQLKQVLNNGINTPYVEVVRNIPYNINTMFGRETVDYGKLENYSGFIKVSEIMLNISAKNEEKSEILSLLRSGVFINENN